MVKRKLNIFIGRTCCINVSAVKIVIICAPYSMAVFVSRPILDHQSLFFFNSYNLILIETFIFYLLISAYLTSLYDDQDINHHETILETNVLLRWWIAAQKALAWRLLHVVRVGNKHEKHRAITSLANLKNLSGRYISFSYPL